MFDIAVIGSLSALKVPGAALCCLPRRRRGRVSWVRLVHNPVHKLWTTRADPSSLGGQTSRSGQSWWTLAYQLDSFRPISSESDSAALAPLQTRHSSRYAAGPLSRCPDKKYQVKWGVSELQKGLRLGTGVCSQRDLRAGVNPSAGGLIQPRFNLTAIRPPSARSHRRTAVRN